MLGAVDLTLLLCSLLITISIGVYHSVKGRKATSDEYMLGGRNMAPLPLAMSMTMGTISSLTMMGNIGEIYTYGTQLWMMDIGVALGMVMVAEMFIPIFFPLKMISVYQYIEERFRSRFLRTVSVVINILAAYLFLGFLLYPPSLFLVQFTGLPQIPNIIIMGLTCGLYSAFGGVKAVVHTDVVQSVIMLIGVLAIVIQCIVSVGGLPKAWQIADSRGRIEFFNLNFDPYQRHSFWLVVTFGIFFSLNIYGVTQSQTQRTFSTGSVKHAKRVIYYAIFGMLLLRVLINLAGVVIFAFYSDCDPLGTKLPNIFIVITYVLQELTKIPGLAGLFVASVYAAVLSSVSTQVNSMTALLWEDFLKHSSCFDGWSDVKATRLQKCIVFGNSIVGVLACIMLVFINSNDFIRLLLKLTGAISGPMVGLFLTGLYLPWVRGKSAVFALAISIGVSFWMVMGQLAYEIPAPYLPMSYDGCNASATTGNATATLSLKDTTASPLDTNTTEATTGHQSYVEGVHPLYGISYCLNYCWGTAATIIFSLLATVLTGWNTPDTMTQNLVAPLAWKVFFWLGSPSFCPPLRMLWVKAFGASTSYETNGDADLSCRLKRDKENYVPSAETIPLERTSLGASPRV